MLKLKTSYGTEENVGIILNTYKHHNTNNLYIGLFCDEGPYADITVNLNYGRLKDGCAFIDTNNFPDGIAFIAEYKLGKPTGDVGRSGYCTYPLYEFDMQKLQDLAEEYKKEMSQQEREVE